MANFHTVLCELEKDYKAIHELWVEAKSKGDLNLAEELLEQLVEMNDLYLSMFGDDVRRHLRSLANKEF